MQVFGRWVVGVLAAVILAGCGDDSSKVVGKWVSEKNHCVTLHVEKVDSQLRTVLSMPGFMIGANDLYTGIGTLSGQSFKVQFQGKRLEGRPWESVIDAAGNIVSGDLVLRRADGSEKCKKRGE